MEFSLLLWSRRTKASSIGGGTKAWWDQAVYRLVCANLVIAFDIAALMFRVASGNGDFR